MAHFKGWGNFQKQAEEKLKRRNRQEETKLQAACLEWLAWQHPDLRKLIMSIPNGAYLHGTKEERIKQWKRLEAEGARKGAADLFLAYPTAMFHGFFLETKTEDGKQTTDQKQFEKDMKEQGYEYYLIRSLEEFQYRISVILVFRYQSDIEYEKRGIPKIEAASGVK